MWICHFYLLCLVLAQERFDLQAHSTHWRSPAVVTMRIAFKRLAPFLPCAAAASIHVNLPSSSHDGYDTCGGAYYISTWIMFVAILAQGIRSNHYFKLANNLQCYTLQCSKNESVIMRSSRLRRDTQTAIHIGAHWLPTPVQTSASGVGRQQRRHGVWRYFLFRHHLRWRYFLFRHHVYICLCIYIYIYIMYNI